MTRQPPDKTARSEPFLASGPLTNLPKRLWRRNDVFQARTEFLQGRMAAVMTTIKICPDRRMDCETPRRAKIKPTNSIRCDDTSFAGRIGGTGICKCFPFKFNDFA
jgi:hypothetical protein